jgi:hypothetical protein
MNFGLYISIRYIKGSRIRGKDLNNRSNTLKTLNTSSIIVRRIKNKKLKKLIYYY